MLTDQGRYFVPRLWKWAEDKQRIKLKENTITILPNFIFNDNHEEEIKL